jgi:glycerol uptake facilitator-like aquaporin
MFGTISGAHFNPVVSLMAAARGQLSWASLPLYSLAQLVGGCLGTALANLMFQQPAWEWSTKLRDGSGIWLGEVIATAGLLLVIALTTATRPTSTPSVVAAWIGGAYWFTSSTSLANPAVTAARSLSNSFAGIAPESVPMFWLMQMVGTALAFGLLAILGKWRQ